MVTSKLTRRQLTGLGELQAVHSDGHAWVRPQWLSGTPAERSSGNFISLMKMGLVEGQKYGANRQGQWTWRITDLGRAALKQERDNG